MSVIRVNKSKNYTVMSNLHLREKSLSLKAKGLLSVMLSLPDDWDYSIKGLVAILKEDRTAVDSAIKELKQFGYVTVDKIMPNETKSGRIEYVYNVFEQPKTRTQKQDLEKQGIEILGLENKHQLNTKQLITKKLNNNKRDTSILGKFPCLMENE